MNKLDVRRILENASLQDKVSKIDRSSPVNLPPKDFKKNSGVIKAYQITENHCIDCLMLRNSVVLKKDCVCNNKKVRKSA